MPREPQDVTEAELSLMRRLWEHRPPDSHRFGSLKRMCNDWAHVFEREFAADSRGLDPGLAREGITLLRELPGSADDDETELQTVESC